jgi:serine/threonine protein kinase
VADGDLATFLDRPIHDEERGILYRGLSCLCNAIHYLHKNNIRHEDLKPQNVLIHGNSVLLTDFGFSLDFSDDSMSTTTGRPSAWTIRYSAPEVLDFEPRNRSTDIFSLGCVLLEMVSGIYGTSLSQLKSHWIRTGNGQSSFARNPGAVFSWLRDLSQSAERDDTRPRIRHLCHMIRLMLSKDRMHRPTSQKILDRLSDLNILIFTSPGLHYVPCENIPVCIGLAQPMNSSQAFGPGYR